MDPSSLERPPEDITAGLGSVDDDAGEEEEDEEELEDTIPFLDNAKLAEPDDHEFPVVHVLQGGELTM